MTNGVRVALSNCRIAGFVAIGMNGGGYLAGFFSVERLSNESRTKWYSKKSNVYSQFPLNTILFKLHNCYSLEIIPWSLSVIGEHNLQYKSKKATRVPSSNPRH